MALITIENGDVLNRTRIVDPERPYEVELLCGPCGDTEWRRWGTYKSKSEAWREMADAESRYPMQTFRVKNRSEL